MNLNVAQLFSLIGKLYVEGQVLREQVEALTRELEALKKDAPPPAQEGV